MKKSLYLPAVVFLSLFLPVFAAGQLTDQQKAVINIYIESTPDLAKYDRSIREKVLADPALSTDVKSCWVPLRKYAALRNSRNLEDLRSMYSELGTGAPDIREKILPDFMKLDYIKMLDQKPGNDITFDATQHLALLNYYSGARHDRLDPKNAFGSGVVLRPELVVNLRKAASANISKQADDARLILWLEINYWNKMRKDALKKIAEEEKNVRKLTESCLSTLPAKFQEATDKEDNTEQNWDGIFSTPSVTMKFERKGQFAFGSADLRGGGASETVQWNLSVKGSNAEGEWTVVYVDKDKTITRGGSVKAKLEGDIMEYEIIGKEWNIKWNEGVKPYATETAAATIGMREKSTYKRKK